MPDSLFITYWNPATDTVVNDSTQCLDSVSQGVVVPSFITSGFESVISPMVRVTHEVLAGWNLILLAAVLLLVVINKQLYPRQFRQLLSVPGGIAHTNQLLREWTPTRSFIGFSFTLCYIIVMALFVQKTCVVFSRDAYSYNSFEVFSVIFGCVAGWVLLRYMTLSLMGWLFRQKEVVIRQFTVQLSISTLCLLVIQPIIWLVLYIPNSIFVWIGIGILFLAALARLVLEWIETRVFSKTPSFYIFLYFCTLEIAPLLLVMIAGLRFFANNTVF